MPPTDWDVMTIDGLTYRMLESGQAWAVQLADGDSKAHLEWRGLSPAASYDAHPGGRCPRRWRGGTTSRPAASPATSSWAASHRFDGFGQRDHSWGFRHWAGLHQWHWVTGFLADGRTFNLFEVHTHGDVTTVNGFVARARRLTSTWSRPSACWSAPTMAAACASS